jgi:hypothetical protein
LLWAGTIGEPCKVVWQKYIEGKHPVGWLIA